MPLSNSSSDLRDGYETVVACPILDSRDSHDEEGDVPGCLDASLRSPSDAHADANPCVTRYRMGHTQTTSQKVSASKSKTLRPQTVAQRVRTFSKASTCRNMNKNYSFRYQLGAKEVIQSGVELLQECKPANKCKHDQAFEQQPWHPARLVLKRLSVKDFCSKRDMVQEHGLRSGLQRPFKEVSGCVTKMLCHGQSTSLAVIGPQGVGKSLVCQRAVVHSIRASGLPRSSVATINLSGSLHKEELRALKYIARELCQFCGYKFTSSASVDDNVKFLESVMQQMSRERKHVIFMLDDLAYFLQECKSRVLYTLLDLLQRANVQAVVIGVSCMTSVLDLMEKRARSRFSHKVVIVHAPSSNACNEAEVQDTPGAVLASILLLEAARDCQIPESESMMNAITTWNENVNVALASEKVQAAIEYLTFCGISYSRLQDICRSYCCKVLMEISLQKKKVHATLLTIQLLQEAVEHVVCAEDPIQDVLLDCSTLQIQVIQAALRLKQEARQLSFQSIVSEYRNPRTHPEAGLKYAEPAIWAAFQSLKQKDVLFVVGQQNAARVSQSRQQVDLSISSADMRSYSM